MLDKEFVEEMKVAGIFLFFAPLIWLAGSKIIAAVAILSAISAIAIPQFIRRLEKSPPELGKADPLRWYQSVLITPVILIFLYAIYLVVVGALDVYQCHKASGSFYWNEWECR